MNGFRILLPRFLRDGMSALDAFQTLAEWASLVQMEPPWAKYPDIPAGAVGWRMGDGEDYYNRFYRWFSSLSPAEQDRFADDHEPPPEWAKLYKNIRQHPWR